MTLTLELAPETEGRDKGCVSDEVNLVPSTSEE